MDTTRHGQPKWSVWLLLYIFVRVSRASPATSYCSSDLTAGSYSPVWSEYQSTGLCTDHCTGSFALAIVQGNNCWCSNYVPKDQEDTYKCTESCPGIQSEWCGNTEAGLYGYFLLPAGVPAGTAGSGSSNDPSTSSSSPPSSTYVPPSSSYIPPSSTYVPPSSTYVPPSSTYVPPVESSASSISYSASSAPSLITSTPVPTEVYTSVTTVTGEVRTVIITPSPSASADATLGQSSTAGGHGVSTGKVVGIVLGVALGLGLIIGLLVWLWFRRKRRQDRQAFSPESSFVAERNGGDSSGGNSVPSRQVSQMSTAGLLAKAPRINTSGLMGGSDLRSAGTTGSGVDRRSVGTDQRLNPWALYSQEDRLSNVSLQDNHDYSRQLKIANPDV